MIVIVIILALIAAYYFQKSEHLISDIYYILDGLYTGNYKIKKEDDIYSLYEEE